MNLTMTLVLTVQILAALTMAGLILVQHGKGAEMGAALGSGSAGSLFGASGSANFLSRMTALCATVFFGATLVLAFMASSGIQRTDSDGGASVFDNVPALAPPVETGPASAIPGAQAPGASVLQPAAEGAQATGNTTVDAIPDAAAAATAPPPAATTGSDVQPLAAEPAATGTPEIGEAAPSAAETAPAAADNSTGEAASIAADAADTAEAAAETGSEDAVQPSGPGDAQQAPSAQ